MRIPIERRSVRNATPFAGLPLHCRRCNCATAPLRSMALTRRLHSGCRMPLPSLQRAHSAMSSAPAAAGAAAAGSSSALTLSCLSRPEVSAWLDHCTSCFSDKEPYPPPRSYFQLHLSADPMLDLNGVAVLHAPPPAASKPAQPDGERQEEEKSEIETQGRTPEQAAKEAEAAAARKAAAAAAASAKSVIAATARVFVRRMFLENAEITFGGVGEVCTRAEFRSRGYADLCLQRCVRYMRLLHLQLSMLHTSPALTPYYASKGYRSVDRWTGVKSDLEAESEAGIVGEGRKHGAFSLRLMPYDNFFSATMLPQFMSMYDDYSRGFNGPVVRNEEYWQTWVRGQLDASVGAQHAYPIEIYAAFEEWDGSDPAPVPASPIRFLSYMFLQRVPCDTDDGSSQRDRMYVIRDYAVVPHWGHGRADGGRLMFLSLAQYAVRQIRHKFASVDPAAAAAAKISMRFPLPIASRFSVALKVDSESKDEGLMFQPLPLHIDANASPAEAAATEAAERAPVHREFRGQQVDEAGLSSPFAASPFVLHHNSEEMSNESAQHIFELLQSDAKSKLIFWPTDSF